MFAPTEKDCAERIRLFTGERVVSGAGAAHVLGEEACRALLLLGVPGAAAGDALRRASEGAARFMADAAARECHAGRPFLGRYCCGTCSVSLWRHLAAGGMDEAVRRRWLAAAIRGMKAARTGDGRWRHVPFHYVLSALVEIDAPGAVAEMRHAAPALERLLRRPAREDAHDRRRRTLAQRILARC